MLRKYNQKAIWITAVSIVALFIAVSYQAYFTNAEDPVSISLKRIFPAYISGDSLLSVYDRSRITSISRNLNPDAGEGSIDATIERNLLKEKLFKKLGLYLESDEIADELTYVKSGKENEYKSHINRYFRGNESEFIKYVVYPAVIDKKLRIYFADHISNDKRARAEEVLSQVKSGDLSFESAAKQFSDDSYTGQFEGDLGFFEHGQVVPELERVITISPLGKIKESLVTSRFGYHIVYPVETSFSNGKKFWHAKHALFKLEGYDQWVWDSSKNLKVIRLVN